MLKMSAFSVDTVTFFMVHCVFQFQFHITFWIHYFSLTNIFVPISINENNTAVYVA